MEALNGHERYVQMLLPFSDISAFNKDRADGTECGRKKGQKTVRRARPSAKRAAHVRGLTKGQCTDRIEGKARGLPTQRCTAKVPVLKKPKSL